MRCFYCKGLGYEPIEGGRKARCPDCRGTGQEQPPEEGEETPVSEPEEISLP
jgi:DnaJ-class molecular chaperone